MTQTQAHIDALISLCQALPAAIGQIRVNQDRSSIYFGEVEISTSRASTGVTAMVSAWASDVQTMPSLLALGARLATEIKAKNRAKRAEFRATRQMGS